MSDADRYCERGELGRGGMGRVLRVGDRTLDRDVAMKVVSGATDPARLQRFLNEARITGQLEHPNIVPVHELGTDAEGRSYFTMKLIEGESLEDILSRLEDSSGATAAEYPLSRLLQIFLKVCDAVGFAHSRGVIHRDLKPENVMVGAFGEVLVVDWGLAKTRGAAQPAEATAPQVPEGGQSPGLTLEGDLMGTPAYMPPEQARADHAAVDTRSDVFALGALLYAILTLRAPYAEATTIAAIRAAQACKFPAPSQRTPGRSVPPELESICLKAMQADPVDRYEDAADLESDVLAYLEQRLVNAHRYGAGARALRLLARHPAKALAGGVALVAIAIAGGVVGVVTSQKQAADAEAAAAAARAETARVQANAATEAATRSAERAETAETSLAKSRIVARLLRRGRTELSAIGFALKRVHYSADSDDDKVATARKLWKEVEAFGQTVPPDETAQAAWLALKGWMHWSMRDTRRAQDAFAASTAADPEVVCGRLFQAMALLSAYMEADAFPSYNLVNGRIVWHHKPRETHLQSPLRERYEALLDAMRGTPTWGETSADDLQRAFAGMRAWYDGRLDDAIRAFGVALTIPEMDWLGDELLYVRGRARLRAEDFDGAVRDLQRAMVFDSLGAEPWRYAAQAYQMRGYVEEGAGQDPTPSWNQSVRMYEETERRFPGKTNLHQALTLLRMRQAEALEARNGDPLPILDQALKDIDRAVTDARAIANDYNAAASLATRSQLHRQRAEVLERRGGDSRPALRLACSDMLEALAQFPPMKLGDRMLPPAVNRYAKALSLSGVQPSVVFDEWLTQLAAAQAAQPASRFPAGMQAELCRVLDLTERELALRKQQLTLYGGTVYDLPKRVAELEERLKVPPWRRAVDQGTVWIQMGDWAGARDRYAFAAANAPDDPSDAGDRKALAATHYYWATTIALTARGFWTQSGNDPERRPSPDARRAMEDQAITALQRAVALGWSDFERLRTEAALRQLRARPEFQALLKR